MITRRVLVKKGFLSLLSLPFLAEGLTSSNGKKEEVISLPRALPGKEPLHIGQILYGVHSMCNPHDEKGPVPSMWYVTKITDTNIEILAVLGSGLAQEGCIYVTDKDNYCPDKIHNSALYPNKESYIAAYQKELQEDIDHLTLLYTNLDKHMNKLSERKHKAILKLKRLGYLL